MKVDHAKDSNEKLIDRAAEILSNTIPEQKVDAMKDYHKVIGLLKKGNTWHFGPIIKKLELLYIYPGRKLHNSMIVELHELREEMQEKRINQVIDRQRKKDLGDTESPTKIWPLIVGAIIIFFAWPRG